jgi:hypothetical protein
LVVDIPEESKSLLTVTHSIGLGCKALLSSQSLPPLLSIIVRAGNFLNTGTARGGAQAITVESLAQLSLTKSPKNPALSLLDLIADLVREQKPELQAVVSELAAIDVAAKHSLSMAMTDAEALRSVTLVAHKRLLAVQQQQAADDTGLSNIVGQILELREFVDGVYASLIACRTEYESAARFLSADPESTSPDVFFHALSSFRQGLQRAFQASEARQKQKERQMSKKTDPKSQKNEL